MSVLAWKKKHLHVMAKIQKNFGLHTSFEVKATQTPWDRVRANI